LKSHLKESISENIKILKKGVKYDAIFDTITKTYLIVSHDGSIAKGFKDETSMMKAFPEGFKMKKIESLHNKVCKEELDHNKKVRMADEYIKKNPNMSLKQLEDKIFKDFSPLEAAGIFDMVRRKKKESFKESQYGKLKFADEKTADDARKILDNHMNVSFSIGKKDTLIVEDKQMAKFILQKKGMKGLDKQSFKLEKLYQETFSNKDKQYVKMLMKSTGFDQMAKEVDTASEAQLKKMVSNAISSMEKRVKNLPVEKGEPMLKKLKFLKQQGKKLKLIEAVFKEARKYRVGDKVKFVDADWKKTYPNIYEVNYVNPNGGLKLKDLKTGKRLPYTFNDSSVKSESLIESFSEVIKVSGNWKLVRKSKSKPFMFYYENKSNNQHITISFDEKKKEYFVFASKQKAQFFKILKDAEKNAESYMNKNKESFKLESLHKKMFTKKSKLTILHEAFKLKESKKRYKTTSGVLVDIYENEGEYSIGTVNVNGDIAHFPDKYKSETDAKKVANEVILSMKKKVKTK